MLEQTALEYSESDDHLKHTFRGRTLKSFEQFKRDTMTELNGTWASFLASYTWHDRRVVISSPGAKGTTSYDNGVVTVQLELSWPATSPWFRDKIIHDVRRMARAIVESSSLQAEETETRQRIRDAAQKRLDECRRREVAAGRSLGRWEVFDSVARVLVALTGSGTGVALLAEGGGARSMGPFLNWLVGFTAVFSVLQAVLKAPDQIKSWSELQGHFVRLRHDLETFVEQTVITSDFDLGEYKQRLEALERRHADGEVLWRTDLLFIVESTFASLARKVGLSRASAITEPGS